MAGTFTSRSAPSDASLANLPYVPLHSPILLSETGGDSRTQDLNLAFQTGDIAFIAICVGLVALMVPGAGFFYSGLARRKSALSLLWVSLMGMAVTWIQWLIWGYSLAFSSSAGRFIGDMKHAGFRDVLGAPAITSPKVPELLLAAFQGMFASVTTALTIGAIAERGRMLPCLLFVFIWTTLVYDPIACWTWNPNGWSSRLGTLDFAGGTPVHITAGCSALAYSYMLGNRRGHGTQELNYRPHNVTHIVLGTVLLWFGWFGFNAGSALGANLRALMALVNTQLAACAGGITWCLIDYRLEYKWSAVGFCSGVISGLVTITPGSGFVPSWAAVIFGIVGALSCNYATKLKYYLRCDDALDIFAIHAAGGMVGNIMTAFFATSYITHLDGYTIIPGGWIDHHYIQLGYQLADSVAGAVYSFGGTCIILMAIDLLLGRYFEAFQLRVSDGSEIDGIDASEIGEFAYDYVELSRNVGRVSETADEGEERRGYEVDTPVDMELGRSSIRSHHPHDRYGGRDVSSIEIERETRGAEKEDIVSGDIGDGIQLR